MQHTQRETSWAEKQVMETLLKTNTPKCDYSHYRNVCISVLLLRWRPVDHREAAQKFHTHCQRHCPINGNSRLSSEKWTSKLKRFLSLSMPAGSLLLNGPLKARAEMKCAGHLLAGVRLGQFRPLCQYPKGRDESVNGSFTNSWSWPKDTNHGASDISQANTRKRLMGLTRNGEGSPAVWAIPATHTWANTDRNANKPQMSDGRN